MVGLLHGANPHLCLLPLPTHSSFAALYSPCFYGCKCQRFNSGHRIPDTDLQLAVSSIFSTRAK